MNKTASVLIVALMFWGCATLSSSYRQGTTAEMNKQYDKAIAFYQQAALENPKENVYRIALVRARAGASLFHFQKARAFLADGKKKEAAAEYGIALFYDPLNKMIAEEMKALEPAPAKRDKPALEKLESPVKLKGTGEKLSLSFRTPVSVKSIFDTLARSQGVTFLYDDQFRDTSLAIDLSGKDLEQAVNFLCVASRNFYRAIDEKTALIAPDNYTKRLQYELTAIRTFYLSNVNVQDIQSALVQMIKTQTKIPNIQVDKNMNSITIRDTPQAVMLAEKLLRQWDKPKGEVLVDVEIMEVSRVRLQKLGLDFSNTTLSAQLNPASAQTSTSGWLNMAGLKLRDLASYQMTIPQVALQFLEGDSDTKIVAQPQIRGLSGEDMKYLVGQKVPIPQGSFTPIMAGGTNSQPILSYTQQDVGIDIKIKPRVHLEGEVTLDVEIKVSSLAETAGVAGIPIINTREIKNTIRLKDGETNLLAGLLQDEERKSVGGITGLKELPIIGMLFSSTTTNIQQTDVILTLTPHIVRAIPLTDEDRKALWVETDSLSGMAGAAQGGVVEANVQEEVPENQPVEPGENPGANALFLSPASFEVPREREFRVNVELATEKEIGNMSLNIAFNSQILKLKDVIEGGLTRQLGDKTPFLKVVNTSSCTLGFSSPTTGRGFKGQGILAVLVFTSAGPGEVSVSITSYSAVGSNGQTVNLETGEARILVR